MDKDSLHTLNELIETFLTVISSRRITKKNQILLSTLLQFAIDPVDKYNFEE